jgi:Fe-S cluster assembly ATP-binding protein
VQEEQQKRKGIKIMDNNLLEIKDLHVNAGEKEILKGIDLNIKKGEIHVIMGPNGSGKTTTANAILNNPEYTKTEGTITFDGEDITKTRTDEIARKGIFMSFQLPEEIPGVSVTNFLKYAKNKITGQPVKIFQFKDELKKYMEELNMNSKNMERSLNVGFSGGEKKKNEILQMLVLNPKLAILDETDSGLDVDAIKTVSKGIEMFKNENNAVLIITHNTKILHSLKVDYVHVLVNGKIVKTGTQELASEIEENGYAQYKYLS